MLTTDLSDRIDTNLGGHIYNWEPKFNKLVQGLDLFEQLQTLENSTKNNEKKIKVLEVILNELKNWDILNSVIKELWWANSNNPKYIEFRDTLIWLDSSFKDLFPKLESNSFDSLNINDIINSIEKESDWMLNIDLDSKNPISKLKLIDSEYSFDEVIDKERLWELMNESNNKMKEIQNSRAILKGLYSPLDDLMWSIRKNWWKENFKEVLKNSITNFPRDIFWDLNELYANMDIKSEYRISEMDINTFTDVSSLEDLRNKIENIRTKLSKIKTQIEEIQKWVFKKYKLWIKELVERKEEDKQRQVAILKFMKNSWFDLIPKNITNKIVYQLQKNEFTIPWLKWNVQNIDLKNWHFWEVWSFSSKDKWLSKESKVNILMFMNKLISWNLDWPLSIETISSWTWIADTSKLKPKLQELWIVSNLGWNYNKMVENLKKESTKTV